LSRRDHALEPDAAKPLERALLRLGKAMKEGKGAPPRGGATANG
jgi:hypothetical protein